MVVSSPNAAASFPFAELFPFSHRWDTAMVVSSPNVATCFPFTELFSFFLSLSYLDGGFAPQLRNASSLYRASFLFSSLAFTELLVVLSFPAAAAAGGWGSPDES
jgi:hypothetical protein